VRQLDSKDTRAAAESHQAALLLLGLIRNVKLLGKVRL
jgi:hypothetical protein